ncbi:MAG: PDZ domain-containing protein [Actinobacteria bacterium]|nr:MAG: PDZ domain-containing protein [Actinomycetota bacterium]
MRSIAAVAVAVAAIAAGCSNGSSGSAATTSSSTSVASTSQAASGSSGATSTPSALQALDAAFVDVVARVGPSVVEISTPSGLGSGIIYDTAGDIVTNAHVVGSDTSFAIATQDGHTYTATLVGVYAPDDLAVVKVSAQMGIAPAKFADSTKIQVGQITLAIGNPLGLDSSVSQGIVSFNGRTVPEGNGVVLRSVIQTSAAINPGNSGGALVDLAGEVIGIPTLAAADPQFGGGAAPGIGFAIASNTVTRIADQLISQGRVTDSGRAALGVTVATVVDRSGKAAGVLLRAVQTGSAADAAGLRVGDVITAIDGKPTSDQLALQTILAGMQPGATVTIDVTRAGGTSKVSAKLGTLPG